MNQRLKGNLISGDAKQKMNSTPDIPPDNITKKGIVIYRAGACAIRDDGDFFKISRGASQEGLEVALRMAIDRYGKSLTVNGSDFFKEQIIKTAIKLKFDIIFDDPGLEQRRQIIMQSLITENNNERRKQPTQEHGRSNRSCHENSRTVKPIKVTKFIR